MSAKLHNFRIGLFVLIGALLFIGALFAVGLRAYFGEHDVFETYVEGNVESLEVGALVKLRGVTIGKVSSISFIGKEYPEYKNQYVLIRFEVPRGTVWIEEPGGIQQALDREIARGLRARVQAQGFIGASFLALDYVDPKMYPAPQISWAPKHYYVPSAPSQFNQLLASLEKSLHKVEGLDFTGLVQQAESLLDAGNRLAVSVNQIEFKRIGTNANALITGLRESNRDLEQTLDEAKDAIKGTDLPGLSSQTKALEVKLSSAAQEFRQVLANVDTRELNSSLANVRAATEELSSLLHHLEQHPSSIVFSKYPQPAPEMEKPARQ